MSNSNPASQIKVGDYVCFKCDIEQAGQVVEIRSDYRGLVFVLENDQGFEGHYIGGSNRTSELATDCWNDAGNFTI